jgi:hypothetical protein
LWKFSAPCFYVEIQITDPQNVAIQNVGAANQPNPT